MSTVTTSKSTPTFSAITDKLGGASLRRLASDAGWAAICRVGTAVCGLAVTVLLARMLGAVELGVFLLLLQVSKLATLFSLCGLNRALLKVLAIASSKESWTAVRKISERAGALFVVAFCGVSLLLAVVWPPLADRLFHDTAAVPVLILVGLVFARSVAELVSAGLLGLRKARLGLLLLELPRELLFACALLGVWVFAGTSTLGEVLDLYLAIGLLSAFAAAAIWVVTLGHYPRTAKQEAESPSTRNLVGLGVPCLLHGAATLLFHSADLWVLGWYGADHDLGVYAAVTRVTVVIVFVCSIVNVVLPPIAAALYDRKELGELRTLMRTAATWSAVISVPIALVLVVGAGPILGIAFGDEFESGARVLAVLALGQAVSALCGSPAVLLQMTGLHATLTRITVANAVFNLIGNVLVVGPYGMEGVAAVTAASIIAQNGACAWIAYRKVGVSTLPVIRPSEIRLGMKLLTSRA